MKVCSRDCDVGTTSFREQCGFLSSSALPIMTSFLRIDAGQHPPARLASMVKASVLQKAITRQIKSVGELHV